MAIIRNTASMMLKGKVGNTVYYVQETRQLARQALNNSNFGESASRTDIQQSRRVRWSNLVNFYSANKAWMKKAYENLKPGTSIFNRFMQLNINNSTVALTKQQAAAKTCVLEKFVLSQGSLPTIRLQDVDGLVESTINVSDKFELLNKTAGQFSAEILAQNPNFQEGDAIVVVVFGATPNETSFRPCSYEYSELVLDPQSEAEVPAIFSAGNSCVRFDISQDEQAMAIFHTRKVGGKLLISTQSMFVGTALTEQTAVYSQPSQFRAAIVSYGESTTVPLAPGGSTSSSTGNDSTTGGGNNDAGGGGLGD